MDIVRIENMHRAQEIIELQRKISVNPSVSIKFDAAVLLKKLDTPAPYPSTDIEIENIDTITAAIRECKAGHRVLLLNMANARKPGGGWLSGAIAQEEDLFRCTDLHATLKEELYPMRNNEVIYTPKTHILRDASYNDLDEPIEVGVMSVAARQNPFTINGHLTGFVRRETEEKIALIYHIGAIQKYDCLILGALGCGAFNNPPHDIAEIFCDVTNDYIQHFKKIIFAVMSDKYNINCDVFQRSFLAMFAEEPVSEPESELRSRTRSSLDIDEWDDQDEDVKMDMDRVLRELIDGRGKNDS